MSYLKKFLLPVLLCLFIIFLFPNQKITTKASSPIAFVVLSQYKANVDIGKEFYIIAVTSNGKLPSWKSSDSKIASVNTYGKVTPKKSGTATITAKIRGAEASCKVYVNKTIISISNINVSIEHGESFTLTASTSNNSKVIWKSSKKSVATVSENGSVTGMKPGETAITASADGSHVSCKVKVKSPEIKLSDTRIILYRGNTAKITATVSSGIQPTWKTNKKSIVVVDESGSITAVKHGSAIITATVDGISKSCEVIVKQPTITLSTTELKLKKGSTSVITAKVSSGNSVIWSTSNPNVVTIDENGKITAVNKGRAYIYAAEDGIKIRCTVYVTE